MGMSLGIGLGIGMRSPNTGLTCPASIPLSSGVAASVSVPSGDRWYRFVVAETGILGVSFTLTGGTGTITGYLNGSCASLPASSFSASATAFPLTHLVVTAGDVVRIKLTQATGTITGSLTVSPAGIISAATTTDGLGIAITASEPIAVVTPDSIVVKVNGSTRWTIADGTDISSDGVPTITVTFGAPAIAHGDTVTVTFDNTMFVFSTDFLAVPGVTDFPVTNLVP
jgi:hypothetical protein